MNRILLALLAAASLNFCSAVAYAQAYPSKPIRIIVPNAPASSADTIVRIMAPEMSKQLGVQLITENKPGATGIIGYEYVVNQPADGYIVAATLVAELGILPLTVKELRFAPQRDLVPVIGIGTSNMVLATTATSTMTNLSDLIALAKANPGKLDYASSSPVIRLTTELFSANAGISVTYIPYNGGPRFTQAVMAGEVHFGFVGERTVAAAIDKFRVLATTGATRSSLFPNAPTFSELKIQSVPGLSYSLNVRTDTPKAIVEKLYAAASAALQRPEVRATLVNTMQLDIHNEGPEAAAKRLTETSHAFAAIATKIGLRPQ